MKYLPLRGHLGFRQRLEVGQRCEPVFQITASQFAGYERMNQNTSFEQAPGKIGLTAPEMLDPNGRVREDHHADRRRGTLVILGFVPPRAAKRLPASRAISASSPARTKAVFSRIPVNSRARSSRALSIINVVLICISMHEEDAPRGDVGPVFQAAAANLKVCAVRVGAGLTRPALFSVPRTSWQLKQNTPWAYTRLVTVVVRV